MSAEPVPPGEPLAGEIGPVDRLLALAEALRREQRLDDALTLFEHLGALEPGRGDVLGGLASALGAKGRTLESLKALLAARTVHADPEILLEIIREQSLPAIDKFNAHVTAGEIELAESYAAALADLIPRNGHLLDAALTCNQALGRNEAARRYASALLEIDPAHAAARAVLAEAPAEPQAANDLANRISIALQPPADTHPLIRLRDLYDLASEVMCGPRSAAADVIAAGLVAAACSTPTEGLEGSEFEGWAKHYRLLAEAMDLDAVRAPTPQARPAPRPEIRAGAKGADWRRVGELARRLGAEVVFFAAADESYVEQYARWYVLSVLKYCDVPCLVVIHVIGGEGRLGAVADKLGIVDERLVLMADGFDADAVTTRAWDAPPKGMAARPIAHFQCQRFLRVGELMRRLGLPVFVSDIDLLLQRGVRDLVDRAAGLDLMLNENGNSRNAGSRLTANLLLLNPTANTDRFTRFLAAWLVEALTASEVTRWIDQAGLLLARRHLELHGEAPQIGYFDTTTDINNVMYPSYQTHPFRFLSLYRGFDTTSLERDPRVLGEGAA